MEVIRSSLQSDLTYQSLQIQNKERNESTTFLPFLVSNSCIKVARQRRHHAMFHDVCLLFRNDTWPHDNAAAAVCDGSSSSNSSGRTDSTNFTGPAMKPHDD